jgi:hypothetical protein
MDAGYTDPGYTDPGYTDPCNNGELSESRDAAKDASHPADTHESTNAF